MRHYNLIDTNKIEIDKFYKQILSSSLLTNYFNHISFNQAKAVYGDSALVFLIKNDDFYKLYFIASNISSLEEIFKYISSSDYKIVIEVITKNMLNENLHNILNKYFSFYSVYERLRINTNDLKSHFVAKIENIDYATISDLASVESLLLDNFNKYYDNLPTRDKLKDYISNKQILLKREASQIKALLVFTLQNKVSHFNYLLNLNVNSTFAINLTEQYYLLMKEKGIKQIYLWVDITHNIRVKNMHLKYNYKSDNTFNYIFYKE